MNFDRKICFRGKAIAKDGRWVEGHVYTQVFTPGSLDEEWHWYIKPIGSEDWVYWQVAPFSVGEYTGMDDKAGTRIFEGDIIKAVMNGGNYDQYEFPIGQVVFENGAFCLRDRRETTPLCSFAPAVSFEVIGNIYDNQELLGGTE